MTHLHKIRRLRKHLIALGELAHEIRERERDNCLVCDREHTECFCLDLEDLYIDIGGEG